MNLHTRKLVAGLVLIFLGLVLSLEEHIIITVLGDTKITLETFIRGAFAIAGIICLIPSISESDELDFLKKESDIITDHDYTVKSLNEGYDRFQSDVLDFQEKLDEFKRLCERGKNVIEQNTLEEASFNRAFTRFKEDLDKFVAENL